MQKGDLVSVAGCGWQRRRSHLPQVIHRIMRSVRHSHLLENELLEVIVRFLSPHAVGMATHGGDGVDERLRDGASDFGWKPAEVVSLLRAEGDRVIAVVVNPVAGPDLTIVAVARWNTLVLVAGGTPKLKVLWAYEGK